MMSWKGVAAHSWHFVVFKDGSGGVRTLDSGGMQGGKSDIGQKTVYENGFYG